MEYDAIIIGCGHNGLVASYYLQRAGLHVLALEQGPKVGGAATTDELFPGFHFSTCAHQFVLFHPQILDDMQLEQRGLRVFQRDVSQFHPFSNGRYLIGWEDMERFQESIATISRRDARAYPDYVEFWRRAGELFDPYLMTEPPTLGEFLRAAEGTASESIAHTLVTGSRRQLVERFFESPEVQATVGTTFDTGYTDAAGGLLYFAFATALSARLDARGLSGFPQGGMGAVTRALRQAAEGAGVEVRTSTPVTRVHVENGRARGVELSDGSVLSARAILSNADPHRTLTRLVPAEHLPPPLLESARRLRMKAGYMKLHCATQGLPDWTVLPGDGPHHRGNVRICDSLDWIDRSWAESQAGRIPGQSVLGLVCPSVYDSDAAPEGHHTLSIWVEYMPVGISPQKWEAERPRIADSLIRQVARYAPNFPDIVTDSYVHGPPEIEARAGMTRGNMHHVDMTIDHMLGARPLPGCSAYRTPLAGLYLCGSGCHPGGGVSGVPGHNAAQAVLHDLNVPAGKRRKSRGGPAKKKGASGMRGRTL